MLQAEHRDLLVDAGLGLAVAAVVVAAVFSDIGRGGAPPPAAYLIAVGFGALMLVRRQFPVLALIATALGICGYYTADFPSIGLAIPVAAALYSAAEAGRTRWAIAVAVVLVVLSTGFRLRGGESPAYLLGWELASTATLMIAMIALGDGTRTRRRLRAELRFRAEQAAREREREAARRVEEERMRIARELHDVLGHTVSVISLQAAVAAEALADDPEVATAAAVTSALAVIRQSSADAMAELRATLGMLRGSAPLDRIAHLDRLAATMTGGELSVTVRVEGEPVPLPTVVDTTAYRIVQESLTNTLRHAGASKADVLVRHGRDALRVTVVDDGRGAGDGATNGVGLHGMAERAALLGGTLRAGNGERGGFEVEAVLPLVGR